MDTGNASEEHLEQARALEESIKQDCDRAQAAIDVNLSSILKITQAQSRYVVLA